MNINPWHVALGAFIGIFISTAIQWSAVVAIHYREKKARLAKQRERLKRVVTLDKKGDDDNDNQRGS